MYSEKRAALAELGYAEDAQVSVWFAINGVNGVEPGDVRRYIMTALDKRPFQKAVDGLVYNVKLTGRGP